MENRDIDDSLKDFEDSIKRLENSRFEDFFAENYPEQWTALNRDEKESKIQELKEFIERPENKSKLNKIKRRLETFRATEFNLGFLFLGVLLGISGNLVANLLDRDFVKFGFTYDMVVTVIFFFSLWYIDRTFIRKERKEIENDQITNNLIEIIDDFKVNN